MITKKFDSNEALYSETRASTSALCPAQEKPECVVRIPSYGLLVETCRKYGINRTTAFRLAREKLLSTFLIGRRRYVELSSLEALPHRSRDAGGAQ